MDVVASHNLLHCVYMERRRLRSFLIRKSSGIKQVGEVRGIRIFLIRSILLHGLRVPILTTFDMKIVDSNSRGNTFFPRFSVKCLFRHNIS